MSFLGNRKEEPCFSFFLILSKVTKEAIFLAEDNSWPIFSVALDDILKKLR